MKKSLLLLAMLTALSACSQSENTTAPAQTATPVAKETSSPSGDAGILNYKEKLDIAKLGLALQQSGLQEGAKKEAEWNQRLNTAQTNADLQGVFAEQLSFYQKGEQALQPLQMESEQGKRVHEQMLRGFSGIREVLQTIQSLNFEKPEDAVKANDLMPKIKQYGMDVMQGMQGFVELMKANGMKPDGTSEAEFKQKVKEFEEKMKN